ncbi:MAG: hypothetical protein ACRYG7_01375 [Janthinobacterium lividum]
MADEQSSTLAFLQNFYTDVTLYVPFEAQERPADNPVPVPVAVAAPAVTAALPAPVLAPPVAAAPAPLPPLPPLPAPIALTAPAMSKLPSLTEVGPAATPTPTVVTAPSVVPTPAVVSPPAVAAAPPVGPAAAPVAPYLLTTFSTLGTNAQGVVLLVRLPPEQFIKLPRNVFLNNLLKAIGLVMADVVLVNVDGPYPVALQNLRKEIAATHILAFGKNLLDVAVHTTQIYEPVQLPAVGLAYLAGAEVAMIEYDVSLKKRLWSGLQRMFLG